MLSVRLTACSSFTRSKLFVCGETFHPFSSLQKSPDVEDPVDGKLDADVDEDDLMKKRFQARVPEKVYRNIMKGEFMRPVNKEHFNIKHLRKQFGIYGFQSGLNPGIAWPTKDELREIKEHDRMFHPPLREMLDNIAAAEQEKLREQLEYEAEVEENMKKLETYKKEFYAKIEKQKAAVEASKLKQKKLIKEISELLGYDVDPKDPKFQEAVEMKKKEEKKAQKQKKQQESYERMLSKLAGTASSTKKAAASESQDEEKVPEQKNNES